MQGWNLFKVYHIKQKGLNPYYNLFYSYILISIKNNELKFIKIFRKIIFKNITILDSIIIIHKHIFPW